MAENFTFDVSSSCDLQEVDNAVNQANKELSVRYDFRNITFSIEWKRDEDKILLACPDRTKLAAIMEVLRTKMAKRGVPLKNLKEGDVVDAGGGTVRQQLDLQQGIPGDIAKKIVKFLKDQKLKKVQASIQSDQVRVASPSKDSLQEVMTLLRHEDFGIELNFSNYR